MAIGGLLCIRAVRLEEAIARLDDAARHFETQGDTRSLRWDTRNETLEISPRSIELHTEAEDRFGVLMGNLMVGFFNIGNDGDDARQRLSWVREATVATGIPA